MQNPEPSRFKQPEVFIYSIAIALLFLLMKGYEFNSGDQAEHLPLVYKKLQPELYPHDYFVKANQGNYTVRFFYVETVYFFSKILGVDVAVFLLTILCISLSAWAFWIIGYTLSGNCMAGYLSPPLVLLVFYNYFSLGTNFIQENLLVSGSFGLAFTALSIAWFVMQKFRGAFLWLGIAGLFHVMFAFNMFLILFSAYVFLYRKLRPSSEIIILSGIFITLSSAMLIPMIFKQLYDSYTYNHNLYYKIQYIFRNYHHFMPSLFKTTHYIKFIAISICGIVLIELVRTHEKAFLRYFYFIVWLGFIGYWIGLEHLQWMAIGKTQWPKGTTLWISMFSAILFAIVISEILNGKLLTHITRGMIIIISLLIIIPSLIIITHSACIPVHALQGKYKFMKYRMDDLGKMHRWIEKNTATDALFLVPATNDRFQCEAKRSIVSGYRAIIHEPWFMMPWFKNFCTIYHVTLEDGLTQNVYNILDERYNTFNLKNNPNANYPINYRLVNTSTCKYLKELGQPVHVEGNWGLYYY
ncbi:MAG: hypothetical protein N2167_06910 [Flavobacteriales bacterium]|nr:hypothetical protein [Flavobacteriales bacterium]